MQVNYNLDGKHSVKKNTQKTARRGHVGIVRASKIHDHPRDMGRGGGKKKKNNGNRLMKKISRSRSSHTRHTGQDKTTSTWITKTHKNINCTSQHNKVTKHKEHIQQQHCQFHIVIII